MFTNEENLTAKTPSGDFQVTTPEFPLLSQQAVISKEISVPYTNLKLNLYPNTQLDLFCSDNFPFWCTTPKYVTNQYADPSTRLQSPIREGYWLQISSVHPNDEDQKDAWSQNPTLHKHSNFFKNDELGQNCVSGHSLFEQSLLNDCATCVPFYGS